MSNFAGHATAGIIASSICAGGLYYMRSRFHIDMNDIVIPSLSLFVFSLFPDVDIKSTPSKIFYAFTLIALGICYYNKQYQSANILAMITLLPQLVSHRGIFHSPLTALLLPSGIFYLKYINSIDLKLAILIYVASVVGYFTHLVLDKT